LSNRIDRALECLVVDGLEPSSLSVHVHLPPSGKSYLARVICELKSSPSKRESISTVVWVPFERAKSVSV
jgi:hypothetical protein